MENKFYQGKYFKNRNFYEWGIDYEFDRIKMELEHNLGDINLIILPLENNIGAINLNELDLKEKEIFKEFTANIDRKKIDEIYNVIYEDNEKYKVIQKQITILKKYNFREIKKMNKILYYAKRFIEIKEVKNKMIITYMYTIFDNFCSELFKAISIYDSTFINNHKINIYYNELEEANNKIDLIENIVDELLNREFGSIPKKLELIYKYFKIDFNNIKEKIEIFTIERNCLVHNNGIYSEKALRRINKSYKRKFLEQKKVNLKDDIILKYDELIEEILKELEEKVENYNCIEHGGWNKSKKNLNKF